MNCLKHIFESIDLLSDGAATVITAACEVCLILTAFAASQMSVDYFAALTVAHNAVKLLAVTVMATLIFDLSDRRNRANT